MVATFRTVVLGQLSCKVLVKHASYINIVGIVSHYLVFIAGSYPLIELAFCEVVAIVTAVNLTVTVTVT